jgi:hypothetical protein
MFQHTDLYKSSFQAYTVSFVYMIYFTVTYQLLSLYSLIDYCNDIQPVAHVLPGGTRRYLRGNVKFKENVI